MREQLTLDNLTFENVDNDKIPEAVLEVVDIKSRLYLGHIEEEPELIDGHRSFLHENGVTSYVFMQEKTYSTNDETEIIHHVVDELDGNAVGYAEIRYKVHDSDELLFDVPFVGSLETYEGFKRTRQGNLLGRITVLNTLAKIDYGEPLHSDTLLSLSAFRVCKWLERNDLVEETTVSGHVVFKSLF